MSLIDEGLGPIIAYGALIGTMLLGVRGCNMALNNRHIVNPAYETRSYATGITGHVEYTVYAD